MSKSHRQLMFEARNAAALARVYKPMICGDVIFVTRSTLVGIFERSGLSRDKAEMQVDASVSLGSRVRVGCKLYQIHDCPCRLCGGTGYILKSKMSGNARFPCEKCSGRGFCDVVV